MIPSILSQQLKQGVWECRPLNLFGRIPQKKRSICLNMHLADLAVLPNPPNGSRAMSESGPISLQSCPE